MIDSSPEKILPAAPYGGRRHLDLPSIWRYAFEAEDGTVLYLHRVRGGDRGAVILAPGTAMSGLAFFLDTIERNLVEHLVGQGFDVWTLDWRTSPELEAHQRPYTFDDVARYDWPAAVDMVLNRAEVEEVGILAHCLSAPTLLLSLVRGYLDASRVRSIVGSQVGLHLVTTGFGRIKAWSFADRLLPPAAMMHFQGEEVGGAFADRLVSVLAALAPTSYEGGTVAMRRHSAVFGDLVHIPRVNEQTLQSLGPLIPEVTAAFVREAATTARAPGSCALSAEDCEHLDRLNVPITLIVGEENRVFSPAATERTAKMLREVHGENFCRRVVFEGYGHLDCLLGDTAARDIYPTLANALD